MPILNHQSINCWEVPLRATASPSYSDPAGLACGGAVKVIASIEDPAVIKQILAHLERICRNFHCL
jgi:hypothetical protein